MKFKNKAIYIVLVSFLWACVNSNKKENEVISVKMDQLSTKPSRQAGKGFEWEKVSGAGIEFWAQKNKMIQVGISESLPGAFVEVIQNGEPVALSLAIQVFELKNKKIEDVFEFIKDYDGWLEEDKCKFKKIKSDREGVDRYILMPTGKALQRYEKIASQEPICNTCGEWGMGNSGKRYFEIHHNNKNKALFIEIGQDLPLFDEATIIVK